MSAGNLENTGELTAAFPAGRFQIVDGPYFVRVVQLMIKLKEAEQVKEFFTVQHATIVDSSPQELSLTAISHFRNNGYFKFTAVYRELVVTGEYYALTRTGWFCFD